MGISVRPKGLGVYLLLALCTASWLPTLRMFAHAAYPPPPQYPGFNNGVEVQSDPKWNLIRMVGVDKIVPGEDQYYINDYFDRYGHGFALYTLLDGHGGRETVNEAFSKVVEPILNKIEELKNEQNHMDAVTIEMNRRKKHWYYKRMHYWFPRKGYIIDKIEPRPDLINFFYTNNSINYKNVFTDLIPYLDKQMCARSVLGHSGATLTMAVVEKDEDGLSLTVANLGDSGGVLCDYYKKHTIVTVDHTPESDKERIESEHGHLEPDGDSMRLNGLLMVARGLGDCDQKDKGMGNVPSVYTDYFTKFQLPKFLILASDGLWDHTKKEDAVKHILDHKSDNDYGIKLLAQTSYNQYHGDADDVTVLLIKLPTFLY